MKRELVNIISATLVGVAIGYGADKLDIQAVTLPVTSDGLVFYLNPPTNQVVKHEQVHREQINRLGPFGFIKEYLRYPCNLELEAGSSINHPVCKWERKVYGSVVYVKGNDFQKYK